jgi:hypothetical protein
MFETFATDYELEELQFLGCEVIDLNEEDTTIRWSTLLTPAPLY